jgi:cobaltochelatase CobN
LRNTLAALQATRLSHRHIDETTLQRELGALLAPFYRTGTLQPLLASDHAVWMPMSLSRMVRCAARRVA